MILANDYAPYDQLPEFWEGVKAYQDGNWDCPYDGVQGQAWDRGLEYGMRLVRAERSAD